MQRCCSTFICDNNLSFLADQKSVNVMFCGLSLFLGDTLPEGSPGDKEEQANGRNRGTPERSQPSSFCIFEGIAPRDCLLHSNES